MTAAHTAPSLYLPPAALGLAALPVYAKWTVSGRLSEITSPVAVPDKIVGLTPFLDFIDRGHSLASLRLPQAAVGSFPLPVYPNK